VQCTAQAFELLAFVRFASHACMQREACPEQRRRAADLAALLPSGPVAMRQLIELIRSASMPSSPPALSVRKTDTSSPSSQPLRARCRQNWYSSRCSR
jgi:hypothetical protein